MQRKHKILPEWLSGMTRNHVGFARAGSNPADHDILLSFGFPSLSFLLSLFFLAFLHGRLCLSSFIYSLTYCRLMRHYRYKFIAVSVDLMKQKVPCCTVVA